MDDSIDWTDTTPLRLKEAAERAFPNGRMTPSGLRKEATRGRLVIERIAGKDYVSFSAIAAMRLLCRVKRDPRYRSDQESSPSLELAALSLDAALASLDGVRSPPARRDVRPSKVDGKRRLSKSVSTGSRTREDM